MSELLLPLRERLRQEATRLGVPSEVLERDYAIGHILAAVTRQPGLAQALVFKGGTALKKAYFGDYRFSADLDFSAVGGPRADAMLLAVRSVAQDVADELSTHGPFAVDAVRRSEKHPHPTGQEAFSVRVQYPWRGNVRTSVKLEITVDEPVLLPTPSLPLIHGYGEPLQASLVCYGLEEIVAEKLRTLLQAQRRSDSGGWVRNCARDYYDLWRLAESEACAIDWISITGILPTKCAARGVGYDSWRDFFADDVVDEARRSWQSSLADLIAGLPEFDSVVRVLRRVIASVL